MTFGVAEKSENVLVCVFDDRDGSQMKKLAKIIDGKPEPLEKLAGITNCKLIKKVRFVMSTF